MELPVNQEYANLCAQYGHLTRMYQNLPTTLVEIKGRLDELEKLSQTKLSEVPPESPKEV